MRENLLLLIAAICTGYSSAFAASPAEEILTSTGAKGGLVVHVGCGDGELTADLHRDDGYIVQGLDTDAANVAAARRYIQSLGLYGKVVADTFDGKHLPYTNNLVNLLVVSRKYELSRDEMLRTLAPGGTVYVETDAGQEVFTKPWPKDIDEWTHFMHGPDNNAVAQDDVAGPPRRMQWLARPMWTRHHHRDKGTHPAFRGMVSANGRMFCIVDEATAAHIKVPSRWFLIARDAFNGVRLWRRPLPARNFSRRLEQLWRTLVADGDRLYTPLKPDGPLVELDGATGEVIRSYPQTKGAEEVIKKDGNLLVVTRRDGLVVLCAETGGVVWRWRPPEDSYIVPLTLAAADANVFIKTDTAVICLAADTGKERWRYTPESAGPRRRLNWPRGRLVVNDGVALCSFGGKPGILSRDKWDYLGSHPPVVDYGGTLVALTADDGNVLWKTVYRPGLECFPGGLFVVDDLLWAGPDFARGRNLQTGRIEREKPVIERLWTTGHHYRCYPPKATSRYVLTGKRGVEMIHLKGDDHSRSNWLRGTCRLGVVPCNGLIYAPPHSCGCYMEAKLYGFWALAPDSEPRNTTVPPGRLTIGPAHQKELKPQAPSPDDWPAYRHDSSRSGCTPMGLSTDLAPTWQADIGDRLSPPVIAADRVLVADIDSNRLVCVDARSGAEQWTFTGGGRFDSPPTVYRGMVFAGCGDGCVYCISLADGELIWRFLAAPRRLQAVALDRLESVWPVHGSVLVDDGVVYAAAGRSSYLDGGMVLYGLDPRTGKVLCKTLLKSEHAGATIPPPDEKRREMRRRISQNSLDYKTFTAPDRSDSFSMSGARSGVLVAQDGSVYLRQLRFDRKLKRQKGSFPHLFSVSNLLDGAENHRSHWVFGTGDFSRTPVAYSWMAYRPTRGHWKKLSVPYGLMLAFDGKTVYGVRRNHLTNWNRSRKDKYILFGQARPDASGARESLPDFRKDGAKLQWTAPLPLRPRALIRTGDQLFIGGMADKIQRQDPSAPENAAFEGRNGGILYVASCEHGKQTARQELDAPPVWDGMAAARGRLYISLKNGKLLCLGRQ